MTKMWTILMTCGLGLVAVSSAQAQALPVPGVEAARDVPNAHEMPSKTTVHKVAFDMGTANPAGEKVHPMLQTVARYLNTLAKTGVPPENRKLAVVFHRERPTT